MIELNRETVCDIVDGMITVEQAINAAVVKEHNENTRKLAEVIRYGIKTLDDLDSRMEKISDFIAEIEDEVEEPLSNSALEALLREANKLNIIPIDPRTGTLLY
jgi:DNA-binding ferritin-like protein